METQPQLRVSGAFRLLNEALHDVFFPVSCPGCNCLQTMLCTQCKSVMFRPPSQINSLVEAGREYPVWALTLYQSVARKIVLSAKHSGAQFYQEFLLELGFWTGQNLVRQLEQRSAGPILIVPCPSRFTLRVQAKNPAATSFAKGVSDGIKAVAPSLNPEFKRALRLKLLAEKQSNKDRMARVKGRHGTMKIATNGWPRFRQIESNQLAGKEVIVVDDVITTGASMREASRVILNAGGKMAGVLAISAVGKIQN